MRKSSKAPGAPPPGASSQGTPQASSPDLLVGVYALATISGITVLHLFDWEIRIRQSVVEVTAHGDEWEQWIPLRQGWTGRARGYMTRAAAASATYHGGGAFDLSSSGDELTFIGYSDFGDTVIFQGACFAEEVTLSVPNAMVEQEITLRGSVAATTGPRA